MLKLVIDSFKATAANLLSRQKFVNSTTVVGLPQVQFLELKRRFRNLTGIFVEITVARGAAHVVLRLPDLVAQGLRRHPCPVVCNLVRYLLCLVDKVSRAGRIRCVEILHNVLQLRVVLRLGDTMRVVTRRDLHLLLVRLPHVIDLARRVRTSNDGVALAVCIHVLEHGELSGAARGVATVLGVQVLLHDGGIGTLRELAPLLDATVAKNALPHHVVRFNWL